jgi:hypothetical protein
MSRIAIAAGCIALAGALTVSALTRAGSAAPAPAKAEEAPITARHFDEVLRMIYPEFPKIDQDEQIKLKDILRSLEQKFSRPEDKFFLTFEVNVPAFAADGVKDPEGYPVVKEAELPKMVQISLDGYLRKLLERVPARSGATIVVCEDRVEITTRAMLKKEIWGDHPGPYLPLVVARFDRTLLDEALKSLARRTQYNVVLDLKVGEKAKTPVTANFVNTPLDTAITLLADMADLQPVLQDNVIYVTTRENALRWESRQRKDFPGEKPAGPRVGPGLRGPIPPDPHAKSDR